MSKYYKFSFVFLLLMQCNVVVFSQPNELMEIWRENGESAFFVVPKNESQIRYDKKYADLKRDYDELNQNYLILQDNYNNLLNNYNNLRKDYNKLAKQAEKYKRISDNLQKKYDSLLMSNYDLKLDYKVLLRDSVYMAKELKKVEGDLLRKNERLSHYIAKSEIKLLDIPEIDVKNKCVSFSIDLTEGIYRMEHYQSKYPSKTIAFQVELIGFVRLTKGNQYPRTINIDTENNPQNYIIINSAGEYRHNKVSFDKLNDSQVTNPFSIKLLRNSMYAPIIDVHIGVLNGNQIEIVDQKITTLETHYIKIK